MEFKGTKTAAVYIETEYGTRRFAITVDINDAESLMDLMQDFSDYNLKTSKAPEMLERLESLSELVIRKCNLNNDAELKDLLKEVQAAKELIQSATELKEIRE